MNSKVTYVDALSFVLDSCDLPVEISEKLSVLKGQIVRRNSAERKPTAKQRATAEANEMLGEMILEILSDGKPRTVSEIQCGFDEGNYSTQKISAVLKSLGSAVTRTVDKRKAYYSLAK